jgi:hypothetical protein
LTNELGIHLNLAKHEKLASNSLANQLSKHKRNKGYRRVSDTSFEEVEGHKHDFVSLLEFFM